METIKELKVKITAFQHMGLRNLNEITALKAERDELRVRINTALVILDERVDLGDEEGWSEIAEQWLNDTEKSLRGGQR